MKKINIGIQMYSVRDDLAKDFEGTLRKVREMGYDYIEFAGYYGGYTDGKKLKALLDEIGLKSVSVHQGPDMFLEQGQKAYDFFRDYGVKYIVIPWYDGSKLPGNAAWEETKKLFTKISDEAKQNGMSLLYHNHDFEFTKVGDEYQYDIMFRDLNGHLDPEPDTCWMKHGGVNPAEYIRKYGDRINVVHLKDLTYVDGEGKPAYALIGDDGSEAKQGEAEKKTVVLVPLGRGINDFGSILEACSDNNVEYAIVEQDNFTGITPLEGMAESRRYLKDTFGL
jgi:sugar phosphate isomerase/epimerase